MPRLSRRTTQVLSSLVGLLVVLALWWVQGQGEEEADPSRADDTAGASLAPTPEPSAEPSGEPSAEPSDEPSGGPSAAAAVDEHGLAYVDLDDLPPEAADTVALVDNGGPFPYPGKDGSTFGNFEGLLPDRARGYYAEYTVPTPGLGHRGARRVIAGDGGELYWTEDHYASFERIRR